MNAGCPLLSPLLPLHRAAFQPGMFLLTGKMGLPALVTTIKTPLHRCASRLVS